LEDLFSGNFTLEDAETSEKIVFQNVNELVEAGWAVD